MVGRMPHSIPIRNQNHIRVQFDQDRTPFDGDADDRPRRRSGNHHAIDPSKRTEVDSH